MSRAIPNISAAGCIDEAVSRIMGKFNPIKIILFGSYSRGEATADSDLDFLIVMPNGTDRRQTAIEVHRELRDLAMPKDVLVTTPEEIKLRGEQIGSALRPALREGKVLHERG